MTPEFTSRLAAAWTADRQSNPWRELEGSAVLADLSGFTRLTELLVGGGEEGVEVLHRVVTLCLSTVLGRSIELGGDIIAFAGDAALVWFDGDHHLVRAVDAAAGMPGDLATLPAALTGGRRLRVSVGVHTGTFHAVLAGTAQRAVFLCGPATSLLSALQSAAEPGEVMMSNAVAEGMPASCCGEQRGLGVVLRSRHVPSQARWVPAAESEDDIDLTSFISPSVRDLLAADVTMGDHRTASVGFLVVPGLDDLLAAEGLAEVHGAIDRVVQTVTRITRELSIDWLDTDVGVNSVKLLLTSGAPRAIDSDDDRLLLGLRRILDACDRPLRAGAQRGRMYSAPLGIPGRRTYTVLGDPVNVAARAAARAGNRELIAGDALGIAQRSFITATSLGQFTLRNRSRPMQMWRVDAVGPRPRSPRGHSPVAGNARRREAEALAGAWKQTVDGVGCTVEVHGEPGMGSSELLADVCELAGSAATLLIADPFQQFVPYATIAAMVRELSAASGSDVGDGGWTWLAAFAPRLPSHLQLWVPDALATAAQNDAAEIDAAQIDPRTAALRTRQVLVALLTEAMPTPCLLGVDDVEMIDEASRQVIALLRPLARDRSLMLLTSSPPGRPAFADEFASTNTIELGRLPSADARAFVSELAPTLRDDQLDLIVLAGNGNPFVLAELAIHPRSNELPDSLQRLGVTLIDALPAAARALVRDASLFGAAMPLRTVAEVLGRPELESMAAWADTMPVLRMVNDSTLAFRHEAYRRMAYDSLPFHRRRALHSAIADHTSRQPGASDALLAVHYERADRPHEAYPRAARAGRSAKASGGLVEAVDLLGRAASLARVVDRASVAGLLLEEGEASAWLGDLGGAAACYRAAGRVVRDPLERARLCHLQSDLAITLNQFRRARTWAQRGLTATDALGHEAVTVRCQLLLDLGAQLDFAGRHRQSLPFYEQALAVARSADNRTLEGLVHLHLEMAYSALMDLQALPHGDAAVTIFEAVGHDRYLTFALANSGLTAMYLGRWDEAISKYQSAVAHARQSGHALGAAFAEVNIGFLRFRQGHLDDADVHARTALRTFETVGVPQKAGYALLLRGHVAAREARFADAAKYVADARAAFTDTGDSAMVIDCDVSALEHLMWAGRFTDVVAAAAPLVGSMASAEVDVIITFDRVLGQAEAAVGVGEGVGRIERALALARQHQRVYDTYLCLGALVTIADSGGPAVSPALRAERVTVATGLGIVSRSAAV